MKPGLAILPLEVWADISEHPLITRELLAQIANLNGDPDFTDKLQKLLHGCGKHTLGYLDISSKKLKKQHCKPQYRASLDVGRQRDCKFPESEMPENIKSFEQLIIGHLDDQVLDFIHKIKPLFTTNVFLEITGKLKENEVGTLRTVTALAHLLPMLGDGIHAIKCGNGGIHLLEQHFPGTLARAKELILDYAMMLAQAEEASIPANARPAQKHSSRPSLTRFASNS